MKLKCINYKQYYTDHQDKLIKNEQGLFATKCRTNYYNEHNTMMESKRSRRCNHVRLAPPLEQTANTFRVNFGPTLILTHHKYTLSASEMSANSNRSLRYLVYEAEQQPELVSRVADHGELE